jgi:hypothetical protein
MSDEYISFLRDAIQELHGCASVHVDTVPVKERFQGQTVSDDEVEVFHVRGHPTAEKLFAWGYPESDDKPDLKAVTVLAVPPITSPREAVQAYVASQYHQSPKEDQET